MRKAILLMMFCGSANAGMYSCVDDSGKKVLRSEPCEQNEKQQPIVIKADPSYYVINSTGERHGIDSYRAKQAQETIAQSAAQKSTDSSQPIDRKQSNSQELMETGGIGGAVEARRSIDSQEHARELMQTGGIGGGGRGAHVYGYGKQ